MNAPGTATERFVPVNDRGLAYGDGLFETIAIVGGKARWLDRHLARLARGCQTLGLKPPDTQAIRQQILGTAAHSPEALLKVIAVREAGGRGYQPDPDAATRLHFLTAPLPAVDHEAVTSGVDVPLLPFRLTPAGPLCGLKHLNRLEQVLASRALDGYREGLLLDRFARVVEGTRTNLFAVRNATLITPHLGESGVAGVLREAILDWAVQQRIPVQEVDLYPYELARCEEAMLVNSVLGVWPIRTVMLRPHGATLARFAPGQHARALQAHFGR